MFIDYYDVLSVESIATSEEIKLAYREQSKKWHPDRNLNIDTTDKMQLINEAYLILNDHEARSRYDIEYFKFKQKNTNIRNDCFSESEEKNSSKQYKYEDYKVDDEILEKWMKNARHQAVDIVKKILQEVGELTVDATKAAGKKMGELLIGYLIFGVIMLVLFKACSS